MRQEDVDLYPRKRGQKISPNDIDKAIGARIRAVRMVFGYKQDQLAQHLGLTLQQTQKYENGKNKISVSMLIKIAEFFNVPIEYFVPHDIRSNHHNMMESMKIADLQNNPNVGFKKMESTQSQYGHKIAEDWKPIGGKKNDKPNDTDKAKPVDETLQENTESNVQHLHGDVLKNEPKDDMDIIIQVAELVSRITDSERTKDMIEILKKMNNKKDK